MKAILQFLLLVGAFLLIWFGLSQINFLKNINVEKISREQENKLGDLLLEELKRHDGIITNDSINAVVNLISKKICEANNINPDDIKPVVLRNSNVNAFALPGGHLVILSGLIEYCKTPEELAGVMAHEISHIEKDHVMKKLIKEVGISMLFVIAGGNGTFEIVQQVLKLISSSAFDRNQETEADLNAVKLLTNAKINPSGLADFLFRLSVEKEEMPDLFDLVSSHPGSAERAQTLLMEIKKKKTEFAPLEAGDWENLKSRIRN